MSARKAAITVLPLAVATMRDTAQPLLVDGIPRHCAPACVGDARGKLRASPLPRPSGGAAYTRRLAGTLNAVCEHHQKLDGVRKLPRL